MNRLFAILLCFQIGYAAYAQPANDNRASATDVSSLINSCSANAAYTTVAATADQSAGTCAPNGPNYNVWFSFTATATTYINFQVKTGGAFGTMQFDWATLWDAGGTQLVCTPYNSQQYGTMEASYLGLTPGATYYISVDNYAGAGYRGTFSLCLSDVVDYNFKQGATDVSSLINTCSANAAYTSIGASGDQSAGTCAPNGPNYNRWFKFVATATTYIDFQVKTGGAFGTMQFDWATLWDAGGTQLVCTPYNSQQYGTMEASYFGLTPGATYYISVDNYAGAGYRGTFSLCLSDVVDYNLYQGALTLSNLNNWCSANAAYTTVGASPDKNAGACWSNGPNYNRWFKFVAVTPNATIQLMTGGALGTLQYPFMALWQSNGTTQIACAVYSSQYSALSISTAALVVGNTYYISVDNFTGTGYRGSFKLCINNIGTTYYSRANAVWNLNSTWSMVGYGGPAASSFPDVGDVALIQGYDVTVSSNQQAAEVDLDVATAGTSLTIDNSSLTVNGLVSLNNSGNNFSGAITVQNNGSLSINDVLNVTRAGGNQNFGVNISTGCSLMVNSDMNWTSSAGSAVNSLFTVNGTGTVTINRDLNFNSTGGPLIKLQFNNSSLFTVIRDINYTANAGGLEAIELNSTAKLRIGRNTVRGATPYGALTCNNLSTVEFNSAVNSQTVGGDAGAGGDSFSYMNIIFNSTAIPSPQINLGGSTTVNGNLTLTAGIVGTTAGNILNLKNATVTTIGSSTAYVDGPMTYEVTTNVANTIRNFPIGNSGSYRPAILTTSHSDNTSVIYTAQHFTSSADALGYTLPGTVDKVSAARYWQIDRAAVANLVSARVTLYYGISDEVTDYTNLTVVNSTGAGSPWVDIGGTATANGSGNILSGSFSSFGNKFTLANRVGGTNPLPIELKDFTGRFDGSKVVLNWSTASELNNDYFTIERSVSGNEFAELLKVKGAGTKKSLSVYEAFDRAPSNELNYYRLKQTDLDGKATYHHVIAVNCTSERPTTFTVYPNPSSGNDFKISGVALSANAIVHIAIYDMKGTIQGEFFVNSNELNTSRLNLQQALNAGLYAFRFVMNGKVYVNKVVVE